MIKPLVTISILLSGCACFTPSSKDYGTKQCEIARQSVNCTGVSVKGVVAPGIAVAKTLVDSGTVDVGTIEAALISLGFHDATCILTALATDFSKTSATENMVSSERATYRAAFVTNWKATHVTKS